MVKSSQCPQKLSPPTNSVHHSAFGYCCWTAELVRYFWMVHLHDNLWCDKIISAYYWADDKQTSWIIALWWLSVSLWRICITFLWPRSSLKLTGPSSRFEHHLHFASLDTWSVSRYMLLSLLFYSRILSAKTNNKVQIFVENYNFIKS